MPTEIVSPPPLAGGNRAGITQAQDQLADITFRVSPPACCFANAVVSYARLGWPVVPIVREYGR